MFVIKEDTVWAQQWLHIRVCAHVVFTETLYVLPLFLFLFRRKQRVTAVE